MSDKHDFGAHVFGWLILLAAFAALNGLLWIGQEMYHRGEKQQAEALAAELNGLEATIDQDERWLKANRLHYETYGPVYVYNARVDDYSRRINRYNALVEQYNTIAKQAYSRWYLIPIPGRRQTTRAARSRL